ncbi:hypothetical protein HK405_000017 [Cladochytrium tenue]|nr:hypothetical protein HK405_000017 [Cladochytrium tenue]
MTARPNTTAIDAPSTTPAQSYRAACPESVPAAVTTHALTRAYASCSRPPSKPAKPSLLQPPTPCPVFAAHSALRCYSVHARRLRDARPPPHPAHPRPCRARPLHEDAAGPITSRPTKSPHTQSTALRHRRRRRLAALNVFSPATDVDRRLLGFLCRLAAPGRRLCRRPRRSLDRNGALASGLRAATDAAPISSRASTAPAAAQRLQYLPHTPPPPPLPYAYEPNADEPYAFELSLPPSPSLSTSDSELDAVGSSSAVASPPLAKSVQ